MTLQLCPIGVKPYRAYYLTTTSRSDAPTIRKKLLQRHGVEESAPCTPLLTIKKRIMEERLYKVTLGTSVLYTMDKECAMDFIAYGATVTSTAMKCY